MIDRAYCRTMSRYNAWQNKLLWGVLEEVDEVALLRDQGLPQGSVLGTLNHLLWLDQMWLSRLFKVKAPPSDFARAAQETPSPATWWAARFRADGALRMWADTLSSVDLTGDIAFYSLSSESDVIVPRATCVMHMFNQQTDQCARVRQVLSQAGQTLPPTALFLMPRD
ncbi:DinB family protein [Loktanella sp. M215]|uniref:DinB family protein n=1 Tax=Loktanella sp. M215 TaxID=2675431 RepID=UPI001F39B345|nr:damage-inducible protein DinB [Loktanella sp. M215]